MILLAALVLWTVRVLFSVGEMWFERDWPRRTWQGLAVTTLLLILILGN